MKILPSCLAMIASAAVPAIAWAAPEEIQVYMDEMNEPGEFGLDLHNNFVVAGTPGADYAGGQPSLHAYRLTPEFSYGLSPSFALGAYLPLLIVTADTRVGRWDLNLGVGRGYGDSRDGWIAKAIIGVPLR